MLLRTYSVCLVNVWETPSWPSEDVAHSIIGGWLDQNGATLREDYNAIFCIVSDLFNGGIEIKCFI